MKKSVSRLLVSLMLVLAFLGSACTPQGSAPSAQQTEPPPPAPVSTPAESSPAFKAGTYTAETQGYKGMVSVEVAVDESSILSIHVVNHQETEGICEPAIEGIPSAIVEGQTLAVDVITGATYTSGALLTAITNCLKDAGGDLDALREKPAAAAPQKVEQTADVVIIGGGGAGLSAAISALQNGASVIVVEKNAYFGGNTMMAGGAYNAVDPERQQKSVEMDASLMSRLEGYLADDPADYGDFGETLKVLQGQIREFMAGDTKMLFDSIELHMIQIYTGGTRTDRNGYTMSPDLELARILASNSLDVINWLGELGVKWEDFTNTVVGALWPRTHHPLTEDGGTGTGIYYRKALESQFVTLNGQALMETRADSILMDGSRAVGVTAIGKDGTEYVIHANKGVVLASGGYAGNFEMCVKYNTYWDGLENIKVTTGLRNMVGDGLVMAEAIGADIIGREFVQLLLVDTKSSTVGGGIGAGANNQVFVNKEGKRFVDEYAERDLLSKAALLQTDGLIFSISSSTTAGGSPETLQRKVDEGYAVKADTLEDLANQLGIPADVFVAEIEKYNEFMAKGKDEDFNRGFIGKPIEGAPFYATPTSPAMHHTMGGVKIDTEMHVFDTSGNIIPGLYAAGEVTGGVHAGNRLGGNAVAECMIFGRIAGANAALEK